MRHITAHLQVFRMAVTTTITGRLVSHRLDGSNGQKGSTRGPQLRRSLGTSGFQAIVAYGSAGGGAGVDDGSPTLKAVMMVAVEQVGGADRKSGSAGFDGGKGSMIVHNRVIQKCLIAAAAAKIQRGEIIEGARNADRGEQQIVLAIPKAMFGIRKRWRRLGWFADGLLLEGQMSRI